MSAKGTIAGIICGAAVFAIGIGAGIYLGRGSSEATANVEARESTTQSAATTVAEAVTEAATAFTENSAKVQMTAQRGSVWESGEKNCAGYEIAVKNHGALITDWQAVITFNTNAEILQLWNGNYTVEGNVLKVTAVDYNKEIASGGEIGFGFNGSFDAEPQVTDIKLYSAGKEIKTTQNAVTAAAEGGVNTTAPAQATAPTGTPVQQNGQLSVKGTQIVNQSGQPFVIKGVSTHGIAWFPQYITLESFRTLRDSFGANTVRLALYSSSGEGYK